MKCLLFLIPLSLGQLQDANSLVWESKISGTFEANLVLKVHNPGFEGTNWIVVAPKFPDLPCQKVWSVELSPGTQTQSFEQNPLKRPFLQTNVKVGAEGLPESVTKSSLETRLQAKVQLHSRKLVPRQMGLVPKNPFPALKPDETKPYLRSTNSMDHASEEFRSWLRKSKLGRQAGEDDWSVAQRLFLYVRKNITFRDDSKTERKASVCANQKEGNLAAIHALFVALCRSQGIPARSLVGRIARSSIYIPNRAGGGNLNHQWYLRSEWHHFQLGWIPVDLFLQVAPSTSDAKHLLWFARDAGDMIVFHEDFDFLISAGPFGNKEFPGLDSMAIWSQGVGKLEGQTIQEEWKVKKTPKPLARDTMKNG